VTFGALTHREWSIVAAGRDINTCIVANKGCRLVHCGLSAFHSGDIIQDASTTIVDTPLTLILGHDYYVVVSIFVLKGGQ